MSVRLKMLVVVMAVSVVFSTAAYVTPRELMLPEFSRAERAAASEDAERCIQALQHDAEFLGASAGDYGAWDDTYQFVEDRNEAYRTANLIPETFRNLKIDVLVFVNAAGQLVWGEVRKDDAQVAVEAQDLLDYLCRLDGAPLRAALANECSHGLLTTPRGVLLAGSAPIRKSDRTGAVRGTVIMGRFVDETVATALAEQTRIKLQLLPIANLSDTERAAQVRDPARWFDARDPRVLYCHSTLADLGGQPALLLHTELPRAIMQRGRNAMRLAGTISVLSGATLVLVLWFALRPTILDPLAQLTAHAERVGATGDLGARLNTTRQDELGSLAREFDRMVDRLAQSRAELLDVAHRAGMSEVAGEVLHNVGNVLNGVTVSADLVQQRLRGSEVGALQAAAATLTEQGEHLQEFLTHDERGRLLPTFLTELAGVLTAEQTFLSQEMERIAGALEHLREIIAAQQQNSRHQALREDLSPVALVEQALSLTADSCERHGIAVERQLAAAGSIPLDKHRLLQIVMNLLTNAIRAIKQSGRSDGCITVGLQRVTRESGAALILSVRDNGVGIPPENIERIFGLGYSSHTEGQGIGLHSAANLASAMGATLTAESAGPGRGATFTLVLPLVVAEAAP